MVKEPPLTCDTDTACWRRDSMMRQGMAIDTEGADAGDGQTVSLA